MISDPETVDLALPEGVPPAVPNENIMDDCIIQDALSGFWIIDPKKITSFKKGDSPTNTNKILVFKGKINTAVLKWKGTINEKYDCIGCQIDVVSDYGCDGVINNETLFECSDKKGYFILLTGPVNTCEKGGDHNTIHPKSGIIDEENICCLESKILDHYCYSKIESIFLRDRYKGRFMWQGLINGKESVGVNLTENPKLIGYKKDNLIGKIKLFTFDERKGALYTVDDIPTIIRCDEINIDIVNPTNINVWGNWSAKDKQVIIQHGKEAKCLTLKGKSKIHDQIYFGCELDKDCQYGTNGFFIDKTLFKCADNRGVLIPADNSIICCEKDNVHKTIELHKKMFIDPKCICCAEKTDKHVSMTSIQLGKCYFLQSSGLPGLCKWIGTVNDEKCIGLEVKDQTNGTDGTFNGIHLFDSETKIGVIMRIKDIPTKFHCEQINDQIINPSTISSLVPLQNIEKYLQIKKGVTVKLVWEGMVDGVKSFGCILPNKFKLGTNGCFNDMNLFQCEEKKGVIISIDGNFKDCLSNNQHKELKSRDENRIKEESICCVTCTEKPNESAKVKVGDIVAVKFDTKKQFAKLMWIGDVNGKRSVGVELLNCPSSAKSSESAKDFSLIKLFKFEKGKGFLYQIENIEYELEFCKDIYLKNVYDMSKMFKPDEKETLVVVQHEPPIYGRSSFDVLINCEKLVWIQIDSAYLEEKKDMFEDILFKSPNKKSGIYVKKDRTKPFCDQPTYIRKGLVIDMKSVKVKENYKCDTFEKDNIVSYRSEDELCFGRIHEYYLLNDIPCLGIVNSIELSEENEIRYIREDCATKVDTDVSRNKYLGGAIWDPQCISTFKKSIDDDINVNDEIEFISRDGLDKYKGKVILPVKANGIPSVVVELYNEQSATVTKCRINEMIPFRRLCDHLNNNVFIIASFVVKSRNVLKENLAAIKEYFNNQCSPNHYKSLHSHLKIVHDSIFSSSENVTALFSDNEFLEMSIKTSQLFKVKDIQSKTRLGEEVKTILDCVMTHLSIICYMCDEDVQFVRLVVKNENFMNTIRQLLEELQEQSRPFSIEEQLIENILFIYWNVLRSGENLNYNITEKITRCFETSGSNHQIKLASALLISFMENATQKSLDSVLSYFKDLCRRIPSGDIYGFPRSEILIGIGKIGLVEPFEISALSVEKSFLVCEQETAQAYERTKCSK